MRLEEDLLNGDEQKIQEMMSSAKNLTLPIYEMLQRFDTNERAQAEEALFKSYFRAKRRLPRLNVYEDSPLKKQLVTGFAIFTYNYMKHLKDNLSQ
jgi:hypothetical protein